MHRSVLAFVALGFLGLSVRAGVSVDEPPAPGAMDVVSAYVEGEVVARLTKLAQDWNATLPEKLTPCRCTPATPSAARRSCATSEKWAGTPIIRPVPSN